MEASKAEILALLSILDLLDMVRALGGTSAGIIFGTERIYHATGERNTYVFTFDARTGYPLSITHDSSAAAPEDGPSGASVTRAALQLSIDDYVRHDESSIEAPIGIKSDVELLVDTAVSCFYEWTAPGRQQLARIFELLDRDDDGSISGQDVADQLLNAGQSNERARIIAAEMARLLCDSDDPSEEVTFLPFVGFGSCCWPTTCAPRTRTRAPRAPNAATTLPRRNSVAVSNSGRSVCNAYVVGLKSFRVWYSETVLPRQVPGQQVLQRRAYAAGR